MTIMRRGRLTTAVALAILTVPLTDAHVSLAGAGQTLLVWTVSEMERVGKTSPVRTNRDVELFAARGEYEPFQVVVRAADRDMTNVSLAVSDLTGPEGQRIPGRSIALYREHYVEVSAGTPTYNRTDATVVPLEPGWYPDALIPFLDRTTGAPPKDARYRADRVRIAAGENQPYWADLFVPRDAQRGQYEGTSSEEYDFRRTPATTHVSWP